MFYLRDCLENIKKTTNYVKLEASMPSGINNTTYNPNIPIQNNYYDCVSMHVK